MGYIMLETSLLVITISTLGMLSPGPDFFLVVKNAIRYQRAAAMMTVMGLIAAITCHMSYCVAGLALVITTTPAVQPDEICRSCLSYLDWDQQPAFSQLEYHHS